MDNGKKNTLLFASYDFSNSGFLIIFQAFLFPAFLSATLASGSTVQNPATAWAWMIAISSLLSVVTAPFVGRLADILGKGYVFGAIVIATSLCSAGSVLAFHDIPYLLIVAFLVFNTTFELSQSLYDSFLLNLSSTHGSLTKLSTFAWGFGYLGGALFSVLFLVLDHYSLGHVSMLAIFAGLYFLLSLPSILGFQRIAPRTGRLLGQKDSKRLFQTKPPIPWSQLTIYWLIADCVATVMYFAPLYMKTELGLSLKVVGGLTLGAQVIAFPLTILMGRLATVLGILTTIRLSLGIWIVCLLGLALANNLIHVVLVMCGLSVVIGSTQALLRAQFASRVGTMDSGESMGYYAIAQKSSSIIAPLIVIAMSTVFNSLRASFFVLTLLIGVSIILSMRLPKSTAIQTTTT